MSISPPSRPYILTFTDLVYAALAAYGLELTGTALDHHDSWAAVYLSAGGVWMFYDWYANHYFASDQSLGVKNLPVDYVGLIQYAGLLYAAYKTSAWLLVFLAIRGFRGIVHNEMDLRLSKIQHDRERRRSYNYSSGFMVFVYVPLFFYDKYAHPWGVGWRFAVAIGVWLAAYAIALSVEARLERQSATRLMGQVGPTGTTPGVARTSPGGLLDAIYRGFVVFLALRAFIQALKVPKGGV